MKYVLIFFISVLFLSSCCKEGTGGKSTLIVYPQHHSKSIPNTVSYPDTIFIKFNAKEYPGGRAKDYDTYFIGTPGDEFVKCTGLKCGDYYLFGAGNDPASIPPRVTGGMHVQIKWSNRKKETEIKVAVSES